MEDRALVHSILAGEQQAFGQLISQYERLVAHMIVRLIPDASDQQEVIQDVFVKVYQKLPTFKFESKLSTWIATIAYRMALNVLRKQKKETEDIDRMTYEPGAPDQRYEEANFKDFIHDMVAKMPTTYKTVITLYYLEEFSYPEIVEITGMPEGTVKNYLHRGKKKLRELAEPLFQKEMIRP